MTMPVTQLCPTRDPEADLIVDCHFLIHHHGPHSWEIERLEAELEEEERLSPREDCLGRLRRARECAAPGRT
jgi:hypothetical protein